MQAFSWDDVRHFLAIVEHGSVARAATTLGVNQTTAAPAILAPV